jgi:hypothetical protein
VLASCPEPGIRDAVNVWLEEKDGAFGMRIGVEATSPQWDAHEIWLDIAFKDGRVVSYRGTGATHPAIDSHGHPTIRGAGPLEFRCIEPFRQWTAKFKCQAPEITVQDLMRQEVPAGAPQRDVDFDIQMNMAVPPWVPGSLLAEAGATLSGGVEGEFMSPRYEQLFRASGKLRVGDKNWQFTGTGLRIRRTGARKFEGFWGHCWQSALFPGGKAFGYNTYPPRPDGKPSYNEGFVFDGNGKLKPARAVQIPWMTRLQPSGEDVPLVLETAEGRVSIQGTSFVNTRSLGSAILPPDFPIVQQAHVRYRWDGEQACGMMERSTLPSKMSLGNG